jgi:uncharacterized membrane protein
MSKIEMIERSIKCFELGLWSLLPLIGIPFAVRAFAQARRVKSGQGAMWNPAERYLAAGTQLAAWALALTIGIIALFSNAIASAAFNRH